MSRTAWLWLAVAPPAIAVGATASVLMASSDHLDAPGLQAVLTAVVGGGFVAAGLIARTRRPLNRTGLLLIAVGFTWFLSGLVGTDESLPWTIGVALMALPAGFLIHLLLAYPSGLLQSGWERFVVVTGYALVTVGHGSHLLVEPDPLQCDECPDNAFLVSDQDLVADILTSSIRAVAVVYLLAVVGTLIGRWRGSSMAARRTLTPVLVAGGATLLLFAVSVGAQSFSLTLSEVTGFLASFVLIGVPFLFLTGLLQSRLDLADISRAFAELELGVPQEVQARIRDLLHDPTAELLLSCLHDVGGYEDLEGNRRNLEDARVGRAVIPIERDGSPIAAIIHDEALLEEPELLEQVAAAAGLKLVMDHNIFELRASERRSRALLEASPDSMFRISRDGTVRDYRVQPPIRLFRSAEGMIGSDVYEGDFPDEITERTMALGEEALATGELQLHEYEVDVDGEVRYQEERITPSGENEFLVIVRDVTERKRQEQELLSSERRSRALLEAIPDHLFRISGDGTFLDIQEGTTPEMRPVEAQVGSSVYDYPGVTRELVERVMAAGKLALETGELQTIEWELGAEGDVRHQEGRFMPSGENEFFLVVRDVTLRKQQEIEQAALHRVAIAVARERATVRIFDLVTEEAGRVLGAHSANLIRYEPGGEEAVIVGRWSMPGGSAEPVGERYLTEGAASEMVYKTGRPVRLDLKDGGVSSSFAEQMREWGVDCVVAAPITVAGHPWGAVAATLTAPHSFPPGAEERLAAFTQLVSLALANEEARQQLAASLFDLEASERRSRALLDALPDKMFRLNSEGTVLDVQENVVPSAPRAGLQVGSSVYDSPMSQEVVDRVMATGTLALETGELQTVEWEAAVRGDLRHAEGRFVPSGDDEFFVVMRDVTDRKRQEIEQSALSRVAVAVASGRRTERVFDLVAEEVGRVLGAHAANLIRYEPGGEEAEIVGSWREAGPSGPVRERFRMKGAPSHMVYESGHPVRVELGDDAVTPEFEEMMLKFEIKSVVAAPITVAGRPWGAVAAWLSGPHSFPPGAEARIGAFTRLVSVAVANEESRAQLAASLFDLEASERRSRALLEALPDNMFRISAEGVFLDIQETPSPHMRPVQANVGSSVYDYPGVPRELLDRLMVTGKLALETGELQTIEWELGSEGALRYQEGRFIPSGEHEFFLVVRDVTERKQQEVEQAALHRVALAVAGESRAERIFDLVTEEVGRVLGAHSANLLRYEPNGEEVVVAGQWSGPGAYSEPVGVRFRLDGGAAHRVYQTKRPVRLELTEEGLRPAAAEQMQRMGVNSIVAAPINVAGRLWGAVGAALMPPHSFPAGAEERLSAFTRLVSLALANEEAREQLAASRARLVSAGDEERRRLERNLHDGAQQRLVSVSLSLRLAQARLNSDPNEADELLASANAELAVALEELRELARGIHPAVLTERGLGPALTSLADRTPLPVELEVEPDERLPGQVEAAAYYVVSEALANVAKYARASAVAVKVGQENGRVVIEVVDDGVGGADPELGTGLRGLVDRVEALDGRLAITSPAGEGTRIRAEVPLPRSPLDRLADYLRTLEAERAGGG
jgi:PAS domain S-box-containing protein